MFNLVPAFNLRPFDGISSFVLKKELIDDQTLNKKQMPETALKTVRYARSISFGSKAMFSHSEQWRTMISPARENDSTELGSGRP